MRMELMHPGDGILGGNYHLYNVLSNRPWINHDIFYGYACNDRWIW